jgi:myo-inositol-1(or 4)-monophosphatase
MDMTLGFSLDEAHHTALRAVTLARRVMAEQGSADMRVVQKGSAGDVVMGLDYKSEYLMIEAIRETFPTHRVQSEEGKVVAGVSEWTWLIDPIDGTNNVALGIPLCGSCVTLCHNGDAVVAAIYVAHEDVTYSAMRGHGAFRAGQPIRIHHHGAPELATISWINGYAVDPDDRRSRQALALLDRRFKRTLSLWSPSVDWSLLVRGRTGALLAYKNELEDLLCGVLIALEAGAVLADFDGNPVTKINAVDGLVVAAPEVAPYMAEVLSELRTRNVAATT